MSEHEESEMKQINLFRLDCFYNEEHDHTHRRDCFKQVQAAQIADHPVVACTGRHRHGEECMEYYECVEVGYAIVTP